MYKNLLLLLTLLLFTGCAERGFKLSSNQHTRTATAQSSTDIDASHTEAPKTLIKMKKAVKKELNSPKMQVESVSPSTHSTATIKKVSTFTPPYADYQTLSSSSTEDLIFKRITKTYQKFGNSEIHGHVIYLDTSGLETTLKNTKIYLLPVNKTLTHWYNNYYLLNKNQNIYGTKAHYINSTYLNISKNFAFHGIPPADYYVIIVSDDPDNEKKGKKVYIAKKIKVEKRKKIMTVFSKKL